MEQVRVIRPVRPWQHWRYALMVTVCWLARRHYLVLDRVSDAGHEFYHCRVCRERMIFPNTTIDDEAFS